MNSLEFIENIIKNLKEILKGIDNRIQEDQNYPTLLAHHIGEKEHFEKELAHFHQIKSELEAWEVVKEELQIIFKGKNPYGEPLHRYELNVIGQNKINTLNKALEVEDENSK